MLRKNYSNFVRPHSPTEDVNTKGPSARKSLSGEEAKRIYLEEINKVTDLQHSFNHHPSSPDKRKRKRKLETIDEISDNDLLKTVQNNDINTLKQALDRCPDKINVIDEFGWNLLMIACQANSVDAVKELLKRGIDTNVRDKAGNSAQSLVIKSKNLVLADILLSNKESHITSHDTTKNIKVKLKEEYVCEICSNKLFPDREQHLSSTIHNINASKGKKIPSNYVIPETNRGYQLMLKVGWDKESGLGPEGTGKKYPIKTVQKKDRKGLGHGKKKEETKKEIVRHTNRKSMITEHQKSKKLEINFRREFY